MHCRPTDRYLIKNDLSSFLIPALQEKSVEVAHSHQKISSCLPPMPPSSFRQMAAADVVTFLPRKVAANVVTFLPRESYCQRRHFSSARRLPPTSSLFFLEKCTLRERSSGCCHASPTGSIGHTDSLERVPTGTPEMSISSKMVAS